VQYNQISAGKSGTTIAFPPDMKKTGVIAIAAILTGLLLSPRCHHPTPAAAVVEIAPRAAADSEQKILKELVAAFDRAESAVQKADLDSLMLFYANDYNYHGLNRRDVRRIWDEVFIHYDQVTSKHLFSQLRLVQTGGVKKVHVTCTGGLYGKEKRTGKPITIDSWVQEVHYLVREDGTWRFQGNAGGASPSAPPASAPHHPLF